MKKVSLNFGMRDGKLVEISQVPRGLKCGCTCPCCGSKLIARKGNKKKHHFSHYTVRECEGYAESMLHMAAKEILLNHNKITLPVYNYRYGDYSDYKTFNYNKVIAERKVKDIIPDIQMFFSNGNRIFIEIKVTHEVDDNKIEKLKKIGVSTLEIDLSKLYLGEDVFELGTFRNIILNDTSLKNWVYDRRETVNLKKRKDYLNAQKEIERKNWLKEQEKKKEQKKLRHKKYDEKLNNGTLWLNKDDSLGGYVFYEGKEYGISFEKIYSKKERAPKYVLEYYKDYERNTSISERNLGALWEGEDKKLNGNISLINKKYSIILVKDESPHYNKIRYEIKVRKVEDKAVIPKKKVTESMMIPKSMESEKVVDLSDINGVCFLCGKKTDQWEEFNNVTKRGCCKECADNFKNKKSRVAFYKKL